MNKPKLLIVEDDSGLRRQYRWAFPDHQLLLAETRAAAQPIIARERPPVAIIDLGLPPDVDGASEGFALLRELISSVPDAKVIVATGREEISHGLTAVSMGAFDFCRKPIDLSVLRHILDRAYRLHDLEAENRRLRMQRRVSPIEHVITGDQELLGVCRTVEKLAATDIPTLILGESGTGKELLANALHELGPRAKQAFVAINCAAIPDTLLESELFGYERGAFTGAHKQTVGKVELAHRGTLFLDEIGDLPSPLQAKLLRFLQDQVFERVGGRQSVRVDVRIVCATNQDLSEKIRIGQFREDLLYRLNGVTVRVPPLRERKGDAVILANYFANRFAGQFGRPKGFSAAALTAIGRHSWPGNVRELENRVRRALVMSEGRMIEPADLELEALRPEPVDLDIRTARGRAEREVIQLALGQANGIISTAAKLLNVSRPTLYALLEAHGIPTGPGQGREAARSWRLEERSAAEGE